MERIEVPLTSWTQQGRTSVGAVRTRAGAQVVLGACLVLVGLMGVVLAVGRGHTEFWVGGPLLVVVGAIVMANGRRLRRATRDRAADEEARLAAPYAFALDGDEVHFPAALTWPEERWPLDETTFSVGRHWGHDAVVIESAGRRPRRFPAAGLQQRPADVVSLVERYRSSR